MAGVVLRIRMLLISDTWTAIVCAAKWVLRVITGKAQTW